MSNPLLGKLGSEDVLGIPLSERTSPVASPDALTTLDLLDSINESSLPSGGENTAEELEFFLTNRHDLMQLGLDGYTHFHRFDPAAIARRVSSPSLEVNTSFSMYYDEQTDEYFSGIEGLGGKHYHEMLEGPDGKVYFGPAKYIREGGTVVRSEHNHTHGFADPALSSPTWQQLADAELVKTPVTAMTDTYLVEGDGIGEASYLADDVIIWQKYLQLTRQEKSVKVDG